MPLSTLADPRGAPGTRAPRGSKFFHFHAVFGKNLKNNSNFGRWRTPLGKILDPPQKYEHVYSVRCAENRLLSVVLVQ